MHPAQGTQQPTPSPLFEVLRQIEMAEASQARAMADLASAQADLQATIDQRSTLRVGWAQCAAAAQPAPRMSLTDRAAWCHPNAASDAAKAACRANVPMSWLVVVAHSDGWPQ
jgi:hypothetical protein